MTKLSKIINNSILKRTFILLILLSIFIFICAYSYVNAVSKDLESNLFRLHVIANSNSEEDQKLKYLVRDELISYMNSISMNCTNKEEIINIANEHINNFYTVATQTIKNQRF